MSKDAAKLVNPSYEDWVGKYHPEKNSIVAEERGYEGTMFETYGPELTYVKNIAHAAPNRVWTLVSGDNGGLYITSGWHFVNRLGYFVTAIPCENDDIIEICVGDPDRYYADQHTGSNWIVTDGENIICSVPLGYVNAAEIAEQIASALNCESIELDLTHEDDEDAEAGSEVQIPQED